MKKNSTLELLAALSDEEEIHEAAVNELVRKERNRM